MKRIGNTITLSKRYLGNNRSFRYISTATSGREDRKFHQSWRYMRASIFVSMLVFTGYSTFFERDVIKNNSNIHGHDYINSDTIPLVQLKELAMHNKPDDCWVSIHGHVYDVTEFLNVHPGGASKLMRFAGKDATRGFRLQHPEGYPERFLGEEAYKGELVVPDKKKTKSKKENKDKDVKFAKFDEHKQFSEANTDKPTEKKELGRYYKNLVQKYTDRNARDEKKMKAKKTEVEVFTTENKPALTNIFSANDFEYVAQRILPSLVYSYIQTGSDNEFSRAEDRAALGRIFFRPKCLIDVSQLEMTSKTLGVETNLPFLIGAFSGSALIQEEGEKILIRSSISKGALQIIPKDSDISLEELMKESKGISLFYQYSIDNKDELKNCISFLNNLNVKYPNIKGVFINVDSPNNGNLEHYKKIEAVRHLYEENPAPQIQANEDFKLCWNDLVSIKEKVTIPIILKGLQRPEDIVKSKTLGFNGVMISNHEGKLLDQTQSPIEVLYKTRKELPLDDKFEILVEGGFRRGSDIVKALCLGGKPVISKPILFSELYGQEGVDKGIEILNQEIIRTMKLIGAKSVSELNADFIDCESLNFKLSASKNLDVMYDTNYTKLPPPLFKNQEKLKMI